SARSSSCCSAGQTPPPSSPAAPAPSATPPKGSAPRPGQTPETDPGNEAERRGGADKDETRHRPRSADGDVERPGLSFGGRDAGDDVGFGRPGRGGAGRRGR